MMGAMSASKRFFQEFALNKMRDSKQTAELILIYNLGNHLSVEDGYAYIREHLDRTAGRIDLDALVELLLELKGALALFELSCVQVSVSQDVTYAA